MDEELQLKNERNKKTAVLLRSSTSAVVALFALVDEREGKKR
jgi:hypothetical protein